MMRRTVLVVHPGGLGDVLLGLPALRAIRAAYPSSALGLLAAQAVGDLLACCGEVDRVFPLEGAALTELLVGPEGMGIDLRRWLEACDLAVGWMPDPDGTLAESIRQCGVDRIVLQPATAGSELCSTATQHQSEKLLQSSGPVHGPIDHQPLLLPSRLHQEGMHLLSTLGLSGDVVGIHPGSGSPHKCSPPERLAQLIEEVSGQGWTPVLLEGPADGPAVRALLKRCKHPPAVASGVSLASMAAFLVRLQFFVGHDSGLTHLSSALGVPTLALFGPTDPRRWGPAGKHVAVVTGDLCQCSTWEDVKVCPEKRCLAVPVQDVLKAIASLYERVSGHSRAVSACSRKTVVLQSRATFALK